MGRLDLHSSLLCITLSFYIYHLYFKVKLSPKLIVWTNCKNRHALKTGMLHVAVHLLVDLCVQTMRENHYNKSSAIWTIANCNVFNYSSANSVMFVVPNENKGVQILKNVSFESQRIDLGIHLHRLQFVVHRQRRW